jgi:hypothetical protein
MIDSSSAPFKKGDVVEVHEKSGWVQTEIVFIEMVVDNRINAKRSRQEPPPAVFSFGQPQGAIAPVKFTGYSGETINLVDPIDKDCIHNYKCRNGRIYKEDQVRHEKVADLSLLKKEIEGIPILPLFSQL